MLMFSSCNPKFFAVRYIHHPVSDYHTVAVVPSGDHCCAKTVLSSSEHCFETVAPSGDRCFTDTVAPSCEKVKGMVLYSAVSSPLDRSKRFTLSSPGRPVHSDTVLGFSWKHSSHAAIAQRLFTHISTTVYSQVLIYTAESTEALWSERKCPNF